MEIKLKLNGRNIMASVEADTVLRDELGLLSGGVTAESAKAFADFAAERITTDSNVRGTAAYRTHLIRVLTQRALMELEG